MVTKPVEHIGNIELLLRPLLALLCSRSCPGEVILPTHDAVQKLRNEDVTVISGFHSPMEKECLQILLRGTQPIVLCAARSIWNMRVPVALRKHIDAGRLLIISPFNTDKRLTAELSVERNTYIASLARTVFVPYAKPGGTLENLCRKLITNGKSICTIDSSQSANLVEMGVQIFRTEITLYSGHAEKSAQSLGHSYEAASA